MSITIAPSFTQASYTWTAWKAVQVTKRFNTQYIDDGITYTIWGYDGPEAHQCSIYKGTVPDGLTAAYSQAQNDTDKADFEATYKPYANRQIQRQDRSQLLTAATLTATGSSVIAGINASANYLIINVKNAPTGTTPSITFTVQDVDPIDQTTVMGSPVSFTAMTAAGVQENSFLCNSGSVKVTWTITGTTPSFTGVNVSVICKDGVSTSANVGNVNSAAPTIAGLVGGSDGTNMRAVRTAADGTIRIDPTGTTTQPVSGTLTANIGTSGSLALDATLTGGTQTTKLTDGTNTANVKAASTAAIATDKALVVAISPNNTVPVSGTVTANVQLDDTVSGTFTATAQTQQFNLNAGRSSISWQFTGSWTGTINFEKSIDGTNWVQMSYHNGMDAVNSTTTNGVYYSSVGSTQYVRLRTSGTWTGTVSWSVARSIGNKAITLIDSIPSGVNMIGSIKITDGTNVPSVKAASTTAIASDPALVVTLSPNSAAPNPDTFTSGSITASEQSVTITCPGGDTAWNLGFSGTFSAGTTIIFEGTIDGTNWFTVNGRQTGIVNTVLVNTLSGGSGPYLFRGNTSGLTQFRARCSAFQAADNITVNIRISAGVGAIFLNASIPAGTNTIGNVKITDGTNTPTVKAASTAAVAGDTALVVAISPNNALTTSSLSVGTLNTTAPTSGDAIGGIDATGKLQAVQVDNILGQTPKMMSTATTLTSPGAAPRGLYAYVNAYGTLRVSGESTTLFNDNFDQGIDAVKWTTSKVSGGGSITFSSSTGNINAGTAANAYSVLTSVPTFSNYGSTFLIYATVASVLGPTTGSYRFFGIGNSATTPTAPAALASTSTAVVDAIGFEYDTAGNFYAVIYSNTTNIYRSAALTAPTSSQSRYGFQLRADVVIFYVGTTEYPAASANYQTPNSCVLPILSLSVNAGSTLGSASQINLQALGIGDSGKNSAQLSDGTYPWRKASVDATGALKVSSGGSADTVGSGSLGALNSTVSIAMAGQTSCGMQLSSGTLIGTIVPEISIDGGTTWVGTYFDDPVTNSKTSSLTFTASNTAATKTIIGVGGCSNVRVRVSAYTSGTTACAIRGNQANDPSLLYAAQSGQILPVTTALVGGQTFKQITNLRTDRMGNIRTGNDVILLSDSIEGTTINPLLWGTVASGMTVSQVAGGGIWLNRLNNTVSGNYAVLTSKRNFQVINNSPVRAVFTANILQASGTQCDMGFGAPITTGVVSIGAWFSYSSAGVLTANYNSGGGSGVVTSSAITGIATGSSIIYTFVIELQDQGARFLIEDSTGLRFSDITLTYTSPTNNSNPTATHLPVFARVYNPGSPSISSGSIQIYSTIVLGIDLATGKDWPTQMAGIGRMSVFDPVAMVQTSQMATGAAPTAGTPSNTAALYTTLGGEFIANATATSENLLSIFAYTIPAGYSFYLQGIMIPPLIVSGAATATTATVLEFAVVANCASTNINTGGGQRFTIPGFFQVPITAAVGTVFNGQPCNWSVNTPVLCLPGTVLHIAYKVILGTATASNRNRGNVYVDGFFE
jgi:hypothetical protein